MNTILIFNVFVSIFLYGHYNTLGLEIISSILISLSLIFILKLIGIRKSKKDMDATTKQVQQDIAKNALTNTDLNSLYKLEYDYSYLYNELECKCNPSNYLHPYDPQKVEISNSIYSQLKENKADFSELIALRNRAIKELNIEFSSKELYDILSQIFNPSNFMNENYDAVKLDATNQIYSQILKHKNNIVELERIAIENQINTLLTYNKNKEEEDEIVVKEKKEDGIVKKEKHISVEIFMAVVVISILILGITGIYYTATTYDHIDQSSKKIVKQEQIDNRNNLMKNYSSDKFSLNYPETWEIRLENVLSTSNTAIALQIMEKRKDDYSFAPNINIIVCKTKRIESTNYLAEMSHKQFLSAGFKSDLINIEDCMISGCKASRCKQIVVLEGFEIMQYQYVVKKQDNTTFIITASMDNSDYKEQEHTINGIIESLIIK